MGRKPSTRVVGLVGELVRVAKRRRKRRPSQRNLDVYHAVRIEGESQLAAAALHGVTQGRVSAICKQVAAWHRQCEAEAGNDLAAERELLRRRLEHIYGDALFKLKISGESLITSHWKLSPDGRTTRQSVTRERAFDIRWLREAKEAAWRSFELAQAAAGERSCAGPGAELAERVLAIVRQLQRAMLQEGAATAMPEQILRALELTEVAPAPEPPAAVSPEPNGKMTAARAEIGGGVNCNTPPARAAASSIDLARR